MSELETDLVTMSHAFIRPGLRIDVHKGSHGTPLVSFDGRRSDLYLHFDDVADLIRLRNEITRYLEEENTREDTTPAAAALAADTAAAIGG